MQHFQTNLFVASPPARVRDAIRGQGSGWWTTDAHQDAASCLFRIHQVGFLARFALAAEGAGTRLHFRHEGLVPGLECHARCSTVWATAVLQSLRALCETGEGRPVRAEPVVA